MKKILPILLVGVLLASGFGAAFSTRSSSQQTSVQEKLFFSEPILSDQNEYITVKVPETTAIDSTPGNPQVPVYTKLYSFPFGTVITDVSYTSVSEQIIPVTKEISPAPQPTPLSGDLTGASTQTLEKNNAVYSSSQAYPVSRIEYQVGAGLEGNTHVVLLSLRYYPVVYQPHQNCLLFTPETQITITYEEPQTSAPVSTETNLLIIAPEEFADALQPLVDHKVQHGIPTLLVTTEWIAGHSTGRDLAEQIKYTIKNEIETSSITSVLLVGSFDRLPMRYSAVRFWDWEQQVITDLYYSDVYDSTGGFCSWDYNNNNKFGESSDRLDFYPDVHLGRLACDSVKDVTVVVDKIIHYETETYGSDWFNTMIYIGGDTFPQSPGNDGEDINEINMNIMPQFSPVVIWTSKGNFNRLTISREITNGAGFIDYSGHGFEFGMGTYLPSSTKMKYYYSAYIKDTRNGYKLPIIFFDACLTAKIDYVLQDLLSYRAYSWLNVFTQLLHINTSKRRPCFAWEFIRHDGGGAIATIGATRTAFGGINEGAGRMSIEFFSAYDSSQYLGEMITQMQNEYITHCFDDRFTLEEFVLLGDPTLLIGGYPS
jgi:Peptidase family C25